MRSKKDKGVTVSGCSAVVVVVVCEGRDVLDRCCAMSRGESIFRATTLGKKWGLFTVFSERDTTHTQSHQYSTETFDKIQQH